jgi:hypothetical protein
MLTVFGLLKKVPIWVWLIAIAGGYFVYTQDKIDDLQAEIAKTGLSLDSVTRIDSVTTVRLAQETIAKDSLGEALELAEILNAELIAAAVISVDPDPSRVDTVEVPTELLEDSTRLGHLVDTVYAEDDITEIGELTVDVVAPPCCAPLSIIHAFDPSPVRFTVGLLRFQDESVIFGVRYWGGETEIEAPYARLPAKQKRLIPYVGVHYDLTSRVFGVRGGARLRLPFGVVGFVEGAQPFEETNPMLFTGLIKEF